jgi:uncharacterized repeat protein (TIGR03803 family)
MNHVSRFSCLLLIGSPAPAFPTVAPSQVLTVLHSFGSAGDGTAPIGGLILGPNGALYGATSTGGAFNGGAVFALAPPSKPGGSWSETVIYNFDAKNPIGSMPYAGVIFGPDGKLYGTAETGGPCNCGSAFSLTPPASKGGAWTADVIHAFTGQPTLEPGDGANPYAPLVLGTGGDLYGATQSGGICCGIIFKLNPPAFTGSTASHPAAGTTPTACRPALCSTSRRHRQAEVIGVKPSLMTSVLSRSTEIPPTTAWSSHNPACLRDHLLRR